MCGICGVVSAGGGPPPDVEAVAGMSRRLVHRGPDSDGLFHRGPVALAARRLSIIDLEGGDQPIAGEDGNVVVVQNGEIYNHRELRRELERRGHRFRTASDTEVLVHLYEEHGDDFVARLRGMFALALWDEERGRLLLARDRFGIKPLYYRVAGGQLSFASELKAMLELPGFDRGIDRRALAAYLAFNSIPAPLTIFAEARKLLPGSTLTWERDGAVAERRYARPRPAPAGATRSGPEPRLAAELRDVLRDSVRAHLVADVPVGVLLSGGVDSAGLAALAATETGGSLKTFSIGFEEGSFDELSLARLVAKRYRTDHHELVLRPDAVDLLPRLVEVFDEPFGDSSALPTYLVSQLAAGEVKVALSGEGGDELFGGYYTYVADLLAPRLGRLASLASPFVEALPSSDAKVSFDYKAKRFVRAARLPALERHNAWKEIFAAERRAALLGEADPGWDPMAVYRERYAETEGAEP
ncbi:MAG TPA: asparagine synthase (glutamine-hydrolyzing), partial [Solirubrobacterales bacterium]|nr:asparagine synthase (glutamine-hydrolyzing) [Solirubrobacterales bacterium]